MKVQIYENKLTAAQFQELRILSGMETLDSAMVKTALENSVVCLSAVYEERTIGMLRVVGDFSFTFVIVDVLVCPEYREMGIGSALVEHSVEVVRRLLPEGKWSTIFLVSAKGKEGFYRRIGFRKTPFGESGHGMQMFVQGGSS